MIDNNFINNFDGLMLGDGFIVSTDKKYTKIDGNITICNNIYYIHKCIHSEWLKYIQEDFIENGIDAKIYEEKPSGSCFRKDNFFTLKARVSRIVESIGFLESQYNRWYIKYYNIDEYPTSRWCLDEVRNEWFVRKKIVPRDIVLTPECVANWYMGDGTGNIFRRVVYFATNGFNEEDIDFLILKLDEIGINSVRDKYKRIRISTMCNISRLINYIDPYIIKCFRYKLEAR